MRLRVDAVGEKTLAKVGDEVIVAKDLIENVSKACAIEGSSVLATLKGSDLAGTICAHPLRGKGYDYDVPVLFGDFVTLDAGTGFVHIAPGHGADDYNLGTANGIEVPHTVDADGSYFRHVPIFGGDKPARVLDDSGKEGDANGRVIATLIEANGLLGKGRLRHQYPHYGAPRRR